MISKLTQKTREKIQDFCAQNSFSVIDNSQNHMCFCFADRSKVAVVLSWLQKELRCNLGKVEADNLGAYWTFKEVIGQCDGQNYKIRCATNSTCGTHEFFTVLVSCMNS